MASVFSGAPRTSWAAWVRSGEWQRSADTSIPMLPAQALQIVELALDPDVSAARLIGVVSKDPVLATRVIQLANAAFSAPATEIRSIHEAVVRVGTGLVRNVMTSTCLSALAADPQTYGRIGRDCIEHSIATAHLASLVAEVAGEPPAEAFLYGLLHDVGKLLVLKLARQSRHATVSRPTDAELDEILSEVHTECGGYLLRTWGLPRRLHDPVTWHHDPVWAADAPRSAVVAYVANRLAHRYGMACSTDAFDPLADPVCIEAGLDERTLARIDAQAAALSDRARKMAA